MTATQKKQFNKMLGALKLISVYDSREWLQRNSIKKYGLEYQEALEMVYENIRENAEIATIRIRRME